MKEMHWDWRNDFTKGIESVVHIICDNHPNNVHWNKNIFILLFLCPLHLYTEGPLAWCTGLWKGPQERTGLPNLSTAGPKTRTTSAMRLMSWTACTIRNCYSSMRPLIREERWSWSWSCEWSKYNIRYNFIWRALIYCSKPWDYHSWWTGHEDISYLSCSVAIRPQM